MERSEELARLQLYTLAAVGSCIMLLCSLLLSTILYLLRQREHFFKTFSANINRKIAVEM
jgi:hypothetical protein